MQLEGYRQLLHRAEALFERHGGSSQFGKEFNVFSVLRTETDEVNLHSRFLFALLRHRKSEKERAHNLSDFLTAVADAADFDVDGANVEREHCNIDILVRTSTHAIVIENKIRADDRFGQLLGYAEQMEKEGVEQVDLLYLTLDGHEPEQHSAGGRQVKCVSYMYDLLPLSDNESRKKFVEEIASGMRQLWEKLDMRSS